MPAFRPAGPGSSGKHHRIGWVTEKMKRPPGRRTRATSRISPAESATKGTAPNTEKAMSNDPSRKGIAAASACTSATSGIPGRRAKFSIPRDMSNAANVRGGRCAANHREHGAAPQPISRTSLPARSAADPRSPTSSSRSISGHQTKSPSGAPSPKYRGCSPWYAAASESHHRRFARPDSSPSAGPYPANPAPPPDPSPNPAPPPDPEPPGPPAVAGSSVGAGSGASESGFMAHSLGRARRRPRPRVRGQPHASHLRHCPRRDLIRARAGRIVSPVCERDMRARADPGSRSAECPTDYKGTPSRCNPPRHGVPPWGMPPTNPDRHCPSIDFSPLRSTIHMPTSNTPQVAVNDIGTAEDFLAAIDSTIKYFNDGDIVEGTVVKVDRDEVLLDIGYKTEGVIPSRELSIKHDVDPDEVVEVGDQI